jgi:hypothetical protein
LTGSFVDGGQGGDSDIENAGHMNVVPLFLLESVNTILHHQALVCFSIFGAVAKGHCLVPPPPGANTIHKKSAGSHPLAHRREIASQEESALRKHLEITYAFLFFWPFFLN